MKYVGILLVIAMSWFHPQSDKLLSVEIITSEIRVSKDNLRLTLPLKCKNLSDRNLLLYGFNSDFNRNTEISRICDDRRTGARFALFIYDTNGKLIEPEWRIDDDYKPLPKEKFDELMLQEKENYKTETFVCNKNEILFFERVVDLSDYHLPTGIYFLQIAYYAGQGVEKGLIGSSQVQFDKDTYHASLYQGCVISNKITLTLY